MDDLKICVDCVTNNRFSKWIARNGEIGACGIDPTHGNRARVVLASAFAHEVDHWFRQEYALSEEEPYFDGDIDRTQYRSRGDTYENIFIDMLECKKDVFDAFENHLPDASGYDLIRGDQKFYDSSALYESYGSIAQREFERSEEYWFEQRVTFQWKDFCEAAIYRRRFFGLKTLLDALFGDASQYDKGRLRPIYELPVGQKLHRARLLDDATLKERILKNAAGELSAPPKESARAGRMNVEFIPAFYGAFDLTTAVAEIRPGIDEVVAIGEFELQKPLKVFDFTVFARAKSEDLKHAFVHTRYDFIDQMEGEISKPILSYDKQRDYVPTQIVAEYLGENFGCDAIIYRSSLIRDQGKDNRNIVLLNKGHKFHGAPASTLLFKSHYFKMIREITYDIGNEHDF